MTIDVPTDPSTPLRRLLPLTGVLFAALTVAGDLAIGPFPDGAPTASRLGAFYAGHAGQVALGGTLLGAAALWFSIFGAAVWARTRQPGVPLVVPGLVLLGAAVEAAAQFTGAETYRVLGDLGAGSSVTPGALQTWHVAGSEFFTPGGLAVFLLGAAVAGIGYRAVPRWLGWTALVVAVALFTPVAFGASLAATLWAAVAGVVLAVRVEPRVAPVPQPVS